MSEKLDALNIKETAEMLDIGVPTLEDIVLSLKAPMRDIRDKYVYAAVKIRCSRY